MPATLTDFIASYKALRSVAAAEAASGYALMDERPAAGFYVYALVDPRTQEIFYVGKGIGGRVLKHDERTRRGVMENRQKVRRIQEIYKAGFKTAWRILYVTDQEPVAVAVEAETIRELTAYGLTNVCGGSDIMNPILVTAAENIRARIHAFRQDWIGSM